MEDFAIFNTTVIAAYIHFNLEPAQIPETLESAQIGKNDSLPQPEIIVENLDLQGLTHYYLPRASCASVFQSLS